MEKQPAGRAEPIHSGVSVMTLGRRRFSQAQGTSTHVVDVKSESPRSLAAFRAECRSVPGNGRWVML